MSNRQIVLDTETTGLDPGLGHRIVELACVEIVNRRPGARDFHRYVNPERPSDPGALEVHGLTEEFLSDQPKFRDVAPEFLEFVAGAELIIHNAPFDVAFLNAELALLDLPPITQHVSGVTDSLRLAKDLHPGKRNSLDALCERYAVDNSARTLHGALLDARLLAEVYLAMTRGQDSLIIDHAEAGPAARTAVAQSGPLDLVVLRASAEETAAHAAYLAGLDKASKGACLWRAVEGEVPTAG
ncbi:MAG: DNA polymerase III subunit epsilon [Burkholderiales bacterium]|nr:DNA polymerase III subunit epsilon [Burkholderiales bacterium]